MTTLPHLLELYNEDIASYHTIGRLLSTFNIAVNAVTAEGLEYVCRQIYQTQEHAFKLSISAGYILENTQTSEYSYYRPSLNNQLIHPITLIKTAQDFSKLLNDLTGINFLELFTRPSTKYRLVLITNITFYIVTCPGVPIGCATITTPLFLQRRRGVLCLLRDSHNKPYNNNHCLMRCLAYHRVKRTRPIGLTKVTEDLFSIYITRTGRSREGFEGVTLDELEEFCRIFSIGVKVYQSDRSHYTSLIWRPEVNYVDSMNLDCTEKHFSYITCLDTYSQSYRCMLCNKLWNNRFNYERHYNVCKDSIIHSYKRGPFRVKSNLFEVLALGNIHVPEYLRGYEFMISWDCEARLIRVQVSTDKTRYTFEHEVISISVCSNVPGFTEPLCIMRLGELTTYDLVYSFVNRLEEISNEAATIMRTRLELYRNQLDDEGLEAQFDKFMEQIPVIGNTLITIGVLTDLQR